MQNMATFFGVSFSVQRRVHTSYLVKRMSRWAYREGLSGIVHDRAFWMIQMVDCGRLREPVVSKRRFGWWGGGEQKI